MIRQNSEEISMLIVDDDRHSLNLLFQCLEGQKFRIFVAENGNNALRLARKLKPDIILLDVLLPDINGFEICRRLKSERETGNISVIFMTSLTETVDKLKGFRAGGADYITKPFDYDELMMRIRTHVNLQKLQEELRQERNRFHRLAEAASEGIVIHAGGYVREANRAAADISGYSVQELAGKELHELFMPEYHDLIRREMRYESEQTYEILGRKKDGGSSYLKIHEKTMLYQGKEISILTISDISHEKRLELENRDLRLSLTQAGRFGEMVGISPAMKRVYEHITRASGLDETVVITGETGTGKELAARMIFKMGTNYARFFVAVNCASVLDSLFESQFFGYRKGAFTGANQDTPGFLGQAQGGTLFLDEIGELTLGMQAKLLRVLENGEYMPVGSAVTRTADVRILAATNRNIREMLDKGEMRADFFHRLNVISVVIPPLRDRRKDIPLLVEHFLSQKTRPGMSPPLVPHQILRRLQSHDWPGNVRELFNVLRRYLVNGMLKPEDTLPSVATENIPFLREELPLGRAVEAFEQYYINRTLRRCGGKKKQAAEILGVNRRTLYNKLNK